MRGMAKVPPFGRVFLGALVVPALLAACQEKNPSREREAEENAYRNKIVISAALERPAPSSAVPGCRLRGSVTNTGSRTVTSWAAKLHFHDASGATYHTESTSGVEPMGPNESKPLVLMVSACTGAASVSGEIELVSLGPQ